MTRWGKFAFRVFGIGDVLLALVGVALHLDETASIHEALCNDLLENDYTPWFWGFYLVFAPIAVFLSTSLFLAGIRLIRLDAKGVAIHGAVLCGEIALLAVYLLVWAVLGFVPAGSSNGDGYALTCLGPQFCILYPFLGLAAAWTASAAGLALDKRVQRLVRLSVPTAAVIMLLSVCGLGLRTLYAREIALKGFALDDVLAERSVWPAFRSMYRHCSSSLRPSSRPSEFRDLLVFCLDQVSSPDPEKAVRGAIAMSAILAFTRGDAGRLDLLDACFRLTPSESKIRRALGCNQASSLVSLFKRESPYVFSESARERMQEQQREESLQPPDALRLIVDEVDLDTFEKELVALFMRCPASLGPVRDTCASEVRSFRKRFARHAELFRDTHGKHRKMRKANNGTGT